MRRPKWRVRPVEIIAWHGACEVHERFSGEELRAYRGADPSIRIIAHPECPPDVIAGADFTGSTAKMINWVKSNRPPKMLLVTECSMADNVAAETPEVDFVRALQCVPAHEADPTPEDSGQPPLHEGGGVHRSF